MSAQALRIFGRVVVLVCGVAVGAGIVLLILASSMPAHTDERKTQELTESYEESHFSLSQQERDVRELQIISLRTKKWVFYKIGYLSFSCGSNFRSRYSKVSTMEFK
jgi:hypothetical protein